MPATTPLITPICWGLVSVATQPAFGTQWVASSTAYPKETSQAAINTVTTSGLRTASSFAAQSPAGLALSWVSQQTGISLGGCVGGSVFAGIDITESLCYYATPSGQSGITLQGGMGGGGPFGANFLVGASASNAHNLSDFGGWFAYGGGGVGEGPYSGGDSGPDRPKPVRKRHLVSNDRLGTRT